MPSFANSFFNNVDDSDVAALIPLTNQSHHLNLSQSSNDDRLFKEPLQVIHHHHLVTESNDGRFARPLLK